MVIKIFGGDGEGKTTLAAWLTRELSAKGIVVENLDPGPIPEDGLLEKRMEVLADPADPLKIELKTIPYKAEARPAYARRFRPE